MPRKPYCFMDWSHSIRNCTVKSATICATHFTVVSISHRLLHWLTNKSVDVLFLYSFLFVVVINRNGVHRRLVVKLKAVPLYWRRYAREMFGKGARVTFDESYLRHWLARWMDVDWKNWRFGQLQSVCKKSDFLHTSDWLVMEIRWIRLFGTVIWQRQGDNWKANQWNLRLSKSRLGECFLHICFGNKKIPFLCHKHVFEFLQLNNGKNELLFSCYWTLKERVSRRRSTRLPSNLHKNVEWQCWNTIWFRAQKVLQLVYRHSEKNVQPSWTFSWLLRRTMKLPRLWLICWMVAVLLDTCMCDASTYNQCQLMKLKQLNGCKSCSARRIVSKRVSISTAISSLASEWNQSNRLCMRKESAAFWIRFSGWWLHLRQSFIIWFNFYLAANCCTSPLALPSFQCVSRSWMTHFIHNLQKRTSVIYNKNFSLSFQFTF